MYIINPNLFLLIFFHFYFKLMNGIHSTTNQKVPATTTNIRSYTTFLTPIRTTGPSLQQLIPCLSTVTTATTTTLTNKTSIAKTNTIVATTNSHPPPASDAHDIVDLTEEDEEDNRNRISAQTTTPVRQVYASFSLLFIVVFF
jgi:hypothetical protein